MSKEAWWASSHGSLLMADGDHRRDTQGGRARLLEGSSAFLCLLKPGVGQSQGHWLDGQRTYCAERPVQQLPRCPEGFPEMQGQGHQSGPSVSRRWKLTDLP